MRVVRLLLQYCLVLVPRLVMAQDSSDVKMASEQRPDSAMLITAGVTSGAMSFADHRVQQGVSGVLRYHFSHAVSIAASPTYARMAFPASLGGGSVSGVTDLPIELALDQALAQRWSPTIGVSLGTTLPIGNHQLGLGSGRVGASVGVGLGVSPNDQTSIHIGAGKPLTDYSTFGALGPSGSTWADAEVSYHILERFDAALGFDGDLTSTDTLGAPRALALSLAAGLGGPYTLTVSGGHGVSGPAARWTFALGFGTDFAGFQAIGSSSPIQRLMRAMGGSSHSGPGRSGIFPGRGP